MARKVFFSFHYQRDLWRVNVVRNSGAVEGVSVAGFHDASLWEETTKKGDDAVRKLINKSLDGTSVTVVWGSHCEPQVRVIRDRAKHRAWKWNTGGSDQQYKGRKRPQ